MQTILRVMLFLLLFPIAFCHAESNGEQAFTHHLYNAHTLEPGQADLSLLGVSRLGLAPGFDGQSNLLFNLGASVVPSGFIPYNLGIKYRMWELPRATTSLTNLFLFRSFRDANGKINIAGSLNGITTSFSMNSNWDINFGPYWGYVHLTADVRVGELPALADGYGSIWLLGLGTDYRFSERFFATIQVMPILAKSVQLNSSAGWLNHSALHTKTISGVTQASVAMRLRRVDLELMWLQIIGSKGTALFNLVWRVRS